MPPSDTATVDTPLAPSVEKAYYRKCIELKRRLNDIDAANDEARIKRVRLDRSIMKMRLERAFLLEQLSKRMEHNVDGSEGSGDEVMATPPPDRPHRDKRRRPAHPNPRPAPVQATSSHSLPPAHTPQPAPSTAQPTGSDPAGPDSPPAVLAPSGPAAESASVGTHHAHAATAEPSTNSQPSHQTGSPGSPTAAPAASLAARSSPYGASAGVPGTGSGTGSSMDVNGTGADRERSAHHRDGRTTSESSRPGRGTGEMTNGDIKGLAPLTESGTEGSSFTAVNQ